MTHGSKVPDSDHIARYCKPGTLNENKIPTGDSFRLRSNEPSLSVNWLEFLDANNRNNAIKKLRQCFAQKGFAVKVSGKFAVLNVDTIVTYVHNECGCLLEVIHEGGKDPSHCGVYNIPVSEDKAMLVGELMAEKICALYNALS